MSCQWHRITLFLLALTGLLLCVDCRDNGPDEKYRIGFSQCCDDAWRDVMNAEMYRELAFRPEVSFEMRVANSDSEKQVRQIRELVQQGIDLLIVSPHESKPLTPVIEEVYKAGIPVILIDRKTDSDLYTAYVGADNYEIGRTAARYIINQFDGRGEIIEIQILMTISPAIERHRGFRDALAAAPGMNVVEAIEIKDDPDLLYTLLPPVLEKHPSANIIYAHTDLNAETAYKVAQQMGRAGDLFFVGIDGIPGTGRGIQAVEDGVLDASLLYPAGGGEAIRTALLVLNDLPYERQNTLESIVINSDNARILHNQMKKVESLQESIDEQLESLGDLHAIRRNQQALIFVLLASLLLALVLGSFLWKSLRAKHAANLSLERKNQEILEHEQQLVEMSEEVRRATQAKVDFFTNISHEFRTPLTLILGFAEDLLPSPKLSRDMQQGIGHIQQNALRLLRLVNQLMDFRKIETAKMTLRAEQADLAGFVRNIMGAYEKTAKKRGIDFQLRASHEQLLAWFDAGLMDKVLFNLLSNAFKFTPDGGKIHLFLSVDDPEHQVKLCVEDNGRGLTEEEQAHVFEAFYQGEEQQLTGTGLGLSLSKSLVELHGGTISVKSSKGQGSRFAITLPLGSAHLRDEQLTGGKTGPHASREFLFGPEAEPEEGDLSMALSPSSSLQILVIEDNPGLQFFLHKKLQATYQVVPAVNGKDGLEKAFSLTPDLIICDIMLPGMDGLEITRALKSDLRTSHIPIIILSARSGMEHQIEGTEIGADSYITKPFNINFLQAKIKSLLFNRQVLRESYRKAPAPVAAGKALPGLAEDVNPLDRDFIKKFLSYIEQHHARQDFQVSDLCGEFGLSRSQLYRKVTALLGESISYHIQNVRLRKAEELLMEGKYSIAEIAYQVGYSSPDYFSTVFRSKYGMPPSEFKNSPG